MIRFNRWMQKSHPEYLKEEVLGANPLANPQDPNTPPNPPDEDEEAGAVNVDKLTVAPKPEDFKNEFTEAGTEMVKAHAECCKNWGIELKQAWANAENPPLDPDSEIKINKKGQAFLIMNAMIELCNEQHQKLVDFVNSKGFPLAYYLYKIHELQKATIKLALNRNNASALTKYLFPIHKIVSNILDYGSSPDKKFFSFVRDQLQSEFPSKIAKFQFPLQQCKTILRGNIDVKNPNFTFLNSMDELKEEFKRIQGIIPDIGELGNALSEIQNEATKIESLLSDAIANGVNIPKKILAFNR
jgi:hypothetical protein